MSRAYAANGTGWKAPRAVLGYVLYNGPSEITGKADIVVVATLRTSNAKTGPMVQTWILTTDQSPVDAVKSGDDVHICGPCPHRGNVKKGRKRSCYVQVGQAPQAVYRAWKNGRYSYEWDRTSFAGAHVRLGAYGDPAAVPSHVWEEVLADTRGHTGYTHQWRNPALRGTLAFCQGSADSEKDLRDLRALPVVSPVKTPGTYRVLRSGESTLPGEILCPSESGVSCIDCLKCDGSSGLNIAIPAHGYGASNVEKF